jgi:hypothetical protein
MTKTLQMHRKRFKLKTSKPFAGREKMRKTCLFEFDVPTYKKRSVGLETNHKQSR